jgi:hypothetical protein
MLSGANAFEISNIQEVETEVVVTRQQNPKKHLILA